jgi:MYXO-CTERM domain-containing protein
MSVGCGFGSRSFVSLALGFVVFGLSARAHALQQPDGTTIPVVAAGVTTCSDKNVQVCLDTEEGGPTINALTAAAVTPETYTPLCALTFKVIARGAGYLNTFGWYNVSASGKPPDSDLHSFLECTDGVGTLKVLQIKSSPYYQGGEIGFFMATPEGASGNCPQFNAAGGPVSDTVGHVYYSQRAYNPDNVGANSYVHLITYNSVTFANSFYFAWEDLLSGGDNDFDDLLTRVEGIECSGGGDPCTVSGQLGKCANGIMQCQNGVLTCVQTNQPTTEACNGLDDDCNGQTDEGDLCAANEVCYKGHCVPKCGQGEFQCQSGVCQDGVCIDPKCVGVDCPTGQVCVAGNCQGACDGVTCPYAQTCVEGACVDLCATITCDSDFVCENGVCKVGCNCDPCTASQQCDTNTNKCEDPGCVPNPCGTGTHCVAGQCIDDCDGAACPQGQVCSAGQCVAGSTDGGAGSGGSAADGGLVLGGGSGGLTLGGSGGQGHGATGALAGTDTASDNGGCGCRVAGGGPLGWLGLLGLALVAAGGLVRRRR